MPPRTRQARKGAAARRRRGQYRAAKRRATKRNRGRIARSPRGVSHSGSGYINRRSTAWRQATGRAINRNR